MSTARIIQSIRPRSLSCEMSNHATMIVELLIALIVGGAIAFVFFWKQQKIANQQKNFAYAQLTHKSIWPQALLHSQISNFDSLLRDRITPKHFEVPKIKLYLEREITDFINIDKFTEQLNNFQGSDLIINLDKEDKQKIDIKFGYVAMNVDQTTSDRNKIKEILFETKHYTKETCTEINTILGKIYDRFNDCYKLIKDIENILSN